MRRRRGFTVVEAVISLALTLVFMLLAAQLVKDTQLASLATRRQVLDPAPQFLAQALRNDVHRARGVNLSGGFLSPGWAYDELSLALPDGGTIVYDRNAEQVSRTLIAPDGTFAGTKPLMRDVLAWRWLLLEVDLVELEIVFRRRPKNEVLQRTWHDRGSSVETMRLRLAMRAIPGKRWW